MESMAEKFLWTGIKAKYRRILKESLIESVENHRENFNFSENMTLTTLKYDNDLEEPSHRSDLSPVDNPQQDCCLEGRYNQIRKSWNTHSGFKISAVIQTCKANKCGKTPRAGLDTFYRHSVSDCLLPKAVNKFHGTNWFKKQQSFCTKVNSKNIHIKCFTIILSHKIAIWRSYLNADLMTNFKLNKEACMGYKTEF